MARTRGGKTRARTRETHQSRKLVSYITTEPQLPMEIIYDILSRLPVKTLLRFKSVSKSCYKLIQSKAFIKQHLNYSRQNPDSIFSSILSVVPVPETDKQLFRVNFIDALDKPIDLDLLPFMSGTKGRSPLVLGISDGLVCVMLEPSDDIFICNPLTGDFRKVPPFGGFPEEDEDYIYFGFCLNGDHGYELFRLFYKSFPYDDDEEEVELLLKGEAYSLTTNAWRTIDVKMGKFECLENHSKSCLPNSDYLPVFVRGVFYWEAFDCDAPYVVCFDVESEVFDEFEAPDDCLEATWMLIRLKEEVAAVIYKDEQAFDIWVLDEKDMSWTRKFAMKEGCTLSVFSEDSILTVLGCTKSGKLVVQDHYEKEWKLFLFDMGTKRKPIWVSRKQIETLPYVNTGANGALFLYNESLVSVNAGDEVAGADFHADLSGI